MEKRCRAPTDRDHQEGQGGKDCGYQNGYGHTPP
jgi:hypothetical protein